MAAVSAPHAPNSLTPPSSSNGGQNSWGFSVPTEKENPVPSKMSEFSSRPPLSHQTNGHGLSHSTSRPELSQKRTDTYSSSRSNDSGYLAPARINAISRKDSSISDTGSAPDSLLDLYGNNRSNINSVDLGERKITDPYVDDEDPEHSRWIHRDKLARIESQELQAAGIILPRGRAASKSSRRETSREQLGNGLRSEQAGQKRQRIESFPTEEENEENTGWDLRMPGEAAEDQGDMYRDISGGLKGVSRIPVSKTSPIPIPMEHLERDTPMRRKQSGGWTGEDEAISYPKSRGRSDSIKVLDDTAATPTPAKRLVSDNSPTKKAGVRKASTPASRTTSAQRPKSKPGTDPKASNQRPPTRSGELGGTKRPEGDPPWLATMYKPDPRLPPDQQLLPTVAKRLQQEQWEKEGKFGNTYDTSFRPLNDEEFHEPPEIVPRTEVPDQKQEEDSEWPLRGPKSPTLSTGRQGTAGGYSTMPKITGPPQKDERIPTSRPVRVQEPPEDTKKGGCGCCTIM